MKYDFEKENRKACVDAMTGLVGFCLGLYLLGELLASLLSGW